MQRQVDSALTLLRQEGQQVNQFPGVPLFYASGDSDKGYLTIQRGNEQVIPFFFNKEDLMSLIERYKQQQPNQQLSNVEIEVANLQQVIEVMKTSNDQQLDKIILVPARESLDYVRSLQQSGQQQPARPPQR
uniref:Tic22 family protein n=1 Tax=Desertifilum tharense IPPAS B-1220 TaxID=1781255 RepID=A0ACD5H222_9CYAN